MLPQVERPGTLEKVITALQAVLKFLAPYETPDTWHSIELLNGWYLEPWLGLYEDPMPAGYKKDPLGRVWLRGFLNGSAATSDKMLVLPAGYRPAHVIYTREIYILTDGTVFTNGAVPGYAMLDFSFDTRP